MGQSPPPRLPAPPPPAASRRAPDERATEQTRSLLLPLDEGGETERHIEERPWGPRLGEPGEGDRRARLRGDEQSHLLLSGFVDIRESPEQRHSLTGLEVRPGPGVEGMAGAPHRPGPLRR